MQLMSKRCSALLLKNQMKDQLAENSPFEDRQSLVKPFELSTTTHSPVALGRFSRRYQVSDFQLQQPATTSHMLHSVRSTDKVGMELDNKQNIARINRKNPMANRLKIKKDDQHNKLKIVRSNNFSRGMDELKGRVRYDPLIDEVRINVEGLFDEQLFKPDRIESLFEKALKQMMCKLKEQYIRQPKQFRGDSFSVCLEKNK